MYTCHVHRHRRLYHFTPDSMALTLADGHEVNGKQNFVGWFSCTFFNWSGWNQVWLWNCSSLASCYSFIVRFHYAWEINAALQTASQTLMLTCIWMFQILVIVGTPVVGYYGYFRIIRYSLVWKIMASLTMYFLIGPSNPWILMLYILLDRWEREGERRRDGQVDGPLFKVTVV